MHAHFKLFLFDIFLLDAFWDKGCVHCYDMYLYDYSFRIKYKICNHKGGVVFLKFTLSS